MSSVWLFARLPTKLFEDQRWWQTGFIKFKMILLLAIVFIGIPIFLPGYYLSVATIVGYTAMGALGVQLLIGYTGLITLGHAAFLAVGAYTSTLLGAVSVPDFP
jgi:branched-chain amino acid transport system permease protein